MWQLMRQFTLDMLKQLQTWDAAVTEKTVVDWANAQVGNGAVAAGAQVCGHKHGKRTKAEI